jgi:hypothetical protein
MSNDSGLRDPLKPTECVSRRYRVGRLGGFRSGCIGQEAAPVRARQADDIQIETCLGSLSRPGGLGSKPAELRTQLPLWLGRPQTAPNDGSLTRRKHRDANPLVCLEDREDCFDEFAEQTWKRHPERLDGGVLIVASDRQFLRPAGHLLALYSARGCLRFPSKRSNGDCLADGRKQPKWSAYVIEWATDPDCKHSWTTHPMRSRRRQLPVRRSNAGWHLCSYGLRASYRLLRPAARPKLWHPVFLPSVRAGLYAGRFQRLPPHMHSVGSFFIAGPRR